MYVQKALISFFFLRCLVIGGRGGEGVVGAGGRVEVELDQHVIINPKQQKMRQNLQKVKIKDKSCGMMMIFRLSVVPPQLCGPPKQSHLGVRPESPVDASTCNTHDLPLLAFGLTFFSLNSA